MNILKSFPSEKELLDKLIKDGKDKLYYSNAHIHTPYSFSAFADMKQAFKLAVKENIKILGINDFTTTEGYDEFHKLAVENKIFPLFNIEFMGLWKEYKQEGLLVNDPNNPGRTYLCGKVLNYPVTMEAENKAVLDRINNGNARQMELMVGKLNKHLKDIGSDIRLDFKDILDNYTKGQIRERHIAKVLRIKIDETYSSKERKSFYKLLYSGKEGAVSVDDKAAVENEIRSNLLKAGGKAFVEEDEETFLSIENIVKFIIDAGGIPCYPVLLDDKNGNFTDFERDKEKMRNELLKIKVFCIEFIPSRNNFDILKNYATYFRNEGFLVTFGTEHNTPELTPLKVACRGGVELDAELEKISFESSCVIAAHQYQHAKGKDGYIDHKGIAKKEQITDFILLGKAVVNWFVNKQ